MHVLRDIQTIAVMKIIISEATAKKLRDKHQVTSFEVRQCFFNRTGKYLEDAREGHSTYPPTQWFISETDVQRRLKVVFIRRTADEYVIKTVYKPNRTEERIYQTYGKRS